MNHIALLELLNLKCLTLWLDLLRVFCFKMRSQVTTANPTKHVDPSASDVSAALPNSGRMTIKRKSDEESGAATLKAAKIDEINQESNASEASKFPEEVVEKQVMEIPKIKIEIAYGFADVVPGSSAYDVEPVQVVRDCFNRKTAPNFGFSRHVTENNYVRSCKWYIFYFESLIF